MKLPEWLWTPGSDALAIVASTISIYLIVILLTRLAGLRSFSQMSAFDFAMTVAIGTLIGSAAAGAQVPVLAATLALSTLYALKLAIALARRRWRWAQRAVDNQPLLLMYRGRPLPDNLRTAKLGMDDLRAKLREAGARSRDDVQAAIFETTGDVSVIHGAEDAPPDPWLLRGCRVGDPEIERELASEADARSASSG